MIKNRLEKNLKKLKAWSDRNKIEAYRLYDRDIPEYPFIVDVYKTHYLVYDKTDFIKDKDKNHLPHVVEALQSLFQCAEGDIVIKKRERQEGLSQYEKTGEGSERFVVRESQAQFYINLYDYLDTGLFLDHRPMRQKIYKSVRGKSFLNLFCYTGAVSVFAALGGATTTSVDMSQTYLTWAQDNFGLNDIPVEKHEFVNANALEWLKDMSSAAQIQTKYDVIFLDPPTFSNSKKMVDSFEVEEDQEFLVQSCMKLLAPGGILYFSNNKRRFKISSSILEQFAVRDIGAETIPQDFHDSKIHNCFEIRAR